jgi:arylsulfatase A-like enzyme
VEYMDGQIGKLWEKLRALQAFDKTAILLVGDHGEGLGEYRHVLGYPYFGHIHFLSDVYMKIPLIIRDPSSPQKGVVREEFVSLVDIAPTITKIMGFNPFPHFQGRDLLDLPKNEKRVIFEETYKPEAVRDRFGILSFPWHLIFTPQDGNYELFDLEKDPQEKVNLCQGQDFPSELRPLKQEVETLARNALSRKQDIKVDERTKEMLRALGYVR